MGNKAGVTVYIVAGPTASGKSARALDLAQKQNGVIINCDSMQIYDALPVLTAQPGPEDRAAAPHVLYGAVHPNEKCSAGLWRDRAVIEIEKAFTSNKSPIIVGGTGLYIRALMEGLSPLPPIPPGIRRQAEALHTRLGGRAFHADLQKRDPALASRLDPNDRQRLIRAWEVLEATGRALSDWQREEKLAPPAHWNFKIELVMPEREELYRRCDMRFLHMLENGVLEEVEQFQTRLDNGEVKPDASLTHALGYKSLLGYLRNEIAKNDAVTLAQTETRQYAKRQMTWFRNQL